MKRLTDTILFLIVCLSIPAQTTVISGRVSNRQTGAVVPHATIAVEGTDLSVVTNDDGFFTLKTTRDKPALVVSHLGFESQRIELTAPVKPLSIQLKPTAVALHEVVVWTEDPRELMAIAIRKIPSNYSQTAQRYQCFYRETAMKRQHYIYVAEGVVDMYKTDYSRGNTNFDRVAITKGRRLLSSKRSDTLSIKVTGGPVQPVQLDMVKNTDLLLNEAELAYYNLEMQMPTTIDGRLQYVVSLSPRITMPYPLYYGHVYIDRETLAFTRLELSLDMSDREKATDYMLVRKPNGVRFRPKELTTLIDYKLENGISRISYFRNTFRFNCDWKRRLFATSFSAVCEMVVTDRSSTDARPIRGRDSFDSRDAFYDRVDYFRDPDVWENYNILEPTESLDKAIDRLLKR